MVLEEAWRAAAVRGEGFPARTMKEVEERRRRSIRKRKGEVARTDKLMRANERDTEERGALLRPFGSCCCCLGLAVWLSCGL